MKFLSITIALLALTACSTNQTYLKNSQTGQVVYCGGQVSTDLISYAIQKSVDGNCVENLKANGYEEVQNVQ